jgi:hypothetical protein
MDIYKDNEYRNNHISIKHSYTKAVAIKNFVYMNGQNQISSTKSMDWSDVFEKKSEYSY